MTIQELAKIEAHIPAPTGDYSVIQYDADDRAWYFIGGYTMTAAAAVEVYEAADLSYGRVQIQKCNGEKHVITRDSNAEAK